MICHVSYDPKTQVLDIRSAKFGARIAQIKVEAGAAGTMQRVPWNSQGVEDCDNFWIALKPADSVVFEDGLLGNKKVVVKEFTFDLK
jgi:hypothetical protein